MQADAVRRERHGNRTTFVRVADVASDAGAPLSWPDAAGEVRIVGNPATRAAAVARVREVAGAAKGTVVSGFSLSDLEQLAAREKATLRDVLEELRAAGLELVAEAPFDKLQDARRWIEEVNISGLALARLTIHKLPSADTASWLQADRGAAARRRRHSRVRAAAARSQSRGADHRVRRREAGGAGASCGAEHPVDSGRLGALWPEARAGRADRRCGRRRRRVGGGRREGRPPRAARRDSPQHSRGQSRSPWSENGRFEKHEDHEGG